MTTLLEREASSISATLWGKEIVKDQLCKHTHIWGESVSQVSEAQSKDHILGTQKFSAQLLSSWGHTVPCVKNVWTHVEVQALEWMEAKQMIIQNTNLFWTLTSFVSILSLLLLPLCGFAWTLAPATKYLMTQETIKSWLNLYWTYA